AQHVYEQGDFDSCVSRAYFAVFHVEIAALVKLTPFRQARWGHDRVQAEFNRRLIQDQKRFPAALRFIHNDLIGRRHMADYAAQHVKYLDTIFRMKSRHFWYPRYRSEQLSPLTKRKSECECSR